MRYLLDTNIIAEPTKTRPDPQVLVLIEQFADDIAISSISWHELWFGVKRLPPSTKRQYLEDYLQSLVLANLPILPYTAEAGEWFASERSRLIRLGLPPAYADGQIAAIAKVNDLVLVTRNLSDYVNFEGITTENWFSESSQINGGV